MAVRAFADSLTENARFAWVISWTRDESPTRTWYGHVLRDCPWRKVQI
jgi:hypothetical protein